MIETLLGIITDFKLLQFTKAKRPINVAPSGILTDDNCEQFRKADSSTQITFLPILTEDKLVQS